MPAPRESRSPSGGRRSRLGRRRSSSCQREGRLDGCSKVQPRREHFVGGKSSRSLRERRACRVTRSGGRCAVTDRPAMRERRGRACWERCRGIHRLLRENPNLSGGQGSGSCLNRWLSREQDRGRRLLAREVRTLLVAPRRTFQRRVCQPGERRRLEPRSMSTGPPFQRGGSSGARAWRANTSQEMQNCESCKNRLDCLAWIGRASSSLGLRERKKEARNAPRDRHCGAGIVRATWIPRDLVPAIAAAADVSPRTVSYYFPAKEHILFTEDAARSLRLERWLRDRDPGQSTADAFRAWLVVELPERARDRP